MEWEKKFYDIVRETESNLTNARRKLQGSSTAKPLETHFDFLTPSRPLSSASYQAPLSTSFVNNNDHINYIRRQMGWSAPSTPLPAVPTSLSTGYSSETRELLSKIDSQNMMIEKLERLVRTLNQEKDQYRKQIRDLQNEVGAITSRLNDTKKFDPHLEAQVDLMRYEVRSDLQRLQNMIGSSKTSSMYTNSLERSFKDMQQTVHSDLEELRREVNSMTHRVGRLELDVSTHSANQRDIRDKLKHDALNKSTASYLCQSSSFPSTSGDVFQMRELRSTIAQFHDKLDRLESRLAASRATPATQTTLFSAFPKSPGRAFKSTPKMTLDEFLDDDDDDDDDDDINSDLELDLSDNLDLGSDATEDLSDDLDKLVNAGKTSSTKTKFTSGPKSSAKETTFSVPTSDHGNSDSEDGDLLSDLDLNNLDLGSAGSDPADLDSFEAASVDLKLDDL